MAKPKDWVEDANMHPGALHKALGVPAGKKIPVQKINAAAAKGGKVGREARLAKTLSSMKRGARGR